jgi:hypothetical protein
MIHTAVIAGALSGSPATGPAQPANRRAMTEPWQIAHAPHARHAMVTAKGVDCQAMHVAGGSLARRAGGARHASIAIGA